MSTHENVAPWLRKMGYDGPIPDSLQKICNPSTALIWEQLITKIRPKQEVAHIRKNLILSRLQRGSADPESSCPVREIQVFSEKQKLEKKVKCLENEIEEKEKAIEKISHKNCTLHVQISHTRAEIKEIEQRKFLLEKKSKILEEKVKRAEETSLVAVNESEKTNAEEITESINKCTEKILQKIKTARSTDKEVVNKSIIQSDTRRESLGLLPDKLFNWSDEFDAFLDSSLEVSKNKALSTSSTFVLNMGNERELCNDEEVKVILRNLLRQKSKNFISSWENIYESLLGQVRSLKFEERYNSLDNQIDLTELYFVHVKTELEKDKLRVVLKKLQESTNKRKEEVFSRLPDEEYRKYFELQIEEAGLIGSNNFLRKLIENSTKKDNYNELQMVKKKISQAKNEITIKIENNENIIESTKKILQYIKETQNGSFLELRRLSAGMSDPHVTDVIKEDVHSTEIEIFSTFPLEYNKLLKNKCLDLCSSTVPAYIDLGQNNADQLSRLLEIPFSPAEDTVLNFLQSKITLNVLKALESPPSLPHDPEKLKYKWTDFEPCEEYLEDIINKLMAINNSSAVRQVLGSVDYLKEVHKIAEEQPWKNIVSDKTEEKRLLTDEEK